MAEVKVENGVDKVEPVEAPVVSPMTVEEAEKECKRQGE